MSRAALLFAVAVLALLAGGASAGASRRVCDTGGEAPAWSPTGKWIAWAPEGVSAVCFARADGTHRRLLLVPNDVGPAQLIWAKPNLLVGLGNYTFTSVAFRPKPHILPWGREFFGSPAGESFSLDAKADVLATSTWGNASSTAPITIMRPGGARSTVGDGNAGNANPSLSPDGTHVVWEKESPAPYAVLEASIDGANIKTLATKGGDPVWSPSGREIAFSVGTNLYMIDPSGAHKTLLAHRSGAVLWSPDGRLIAMNSANAIYFLDVRTKQMRMIRGIKLAGQAAWAPDSKELLVDAGHNHSLWLVPVRGGKPRIVVGTP